MNYWIAINTHRGLNKVIIIPNFVSYKSKYDLGINYTIRPQTFRPENPITIDHVHFLKKNILNPSGKEEA
jgi:hypothetical protein